MMKKSIAVFLLGFVAAVSFALIAHDLSGHGMKEETKHCATFNIGEGYLRVCVGEVQYLRPLQ
ncbi:MAG: hypothetical protein AAB355_01265 [Patescibacteria group bacterium]